MKTPEEIKKGLEHCRNNAECLKCTYSELRDTKYTCEGALFEDALAYIKELEEREWQLFDLLSSTWFTKACYFKQEDGTVYSRLSGEYMTFEQAIDEFAHELTDEGGIKNGQTIF